MLRLLLMVPVIALMFCVIGGAHYYLARRLVFDAGLSAGLSALLQGAIIAGLVLLVLQPIGERTLSHRVGRFIAWPASLWMGFAFMLLVGVGASDLLWWAAGTVAEAAPTDALVQDDAGPARLRAAGIVLLAGLASLVGIRNGFAGPQHKRVEITLPRWPKALDGFRIVQISDIHIGPILDRRFAREIVDRVNAMEADLVAVTGDLVDGSVSKLEAEVAPFADLRGRLGVFFVTGNHDHYSGGRAWSEHVKKLGMRVLRNERVTIHADEHEADEPASFELAGVDDHHSRYMPGEQGEDLDAALAGAPQERSVVLLAHDPATFKRASQLGVDLQLSGHTHGGQLVPFNLMVRLAVPFVAGLYRRGDAQLYVSRGTGFWGPPMRLLAPAEIAEIVLRSPAAGA